jgi:hypothetical protein
MGGANAALAVGPWAGLANPAAYAASPLLQAGYEWSELDVYNPGARVESASATLSFGGYGGIGVSRSRFLQSDVVFPGPYGAPDRVLRLRDRSDVAGAAVDIARLAGADRYGLELAFGANYKRLERQERPRSDVSNVLVVEAAEDYDVGALLGWRAVLEAAAPGDTTGQPLSYLFLRAAVAVRNLANDDLAVTGTDLIDETGRTFLTAAALELAVGRFAPDRYALIVRATGEYRTYSGRLRDPAAPATTTEFATDGYRVGGEVVFGGLMSTRVGYIEDDLRCLNDLTFGGGLELFVPLLRINVRADYARVPTRSFFRLADAGRFAASERHDRFAAAAWIGF